MRFADWRVVNGVRIRKQSLTHKLSAVLEERLKRPPKHIAKLQAEFMEQFVETNWLPFVQEQRSSSTVTVYKF